MPYTVKKVVLALLAGIISVSIAKNIEATEPRLSFIDNRIVDYGDIVEGQMANVVIRFKNTGDQTLVIYDDKPTCNCTSVKYDKVTESGESGEIRLSINTKGKYGKEIVVVKLLANTPEEYYIIRVDLNVTKNAGNKE